MGDHHSPAGFCRRLAAMPERDRADSLEALLYERSGDLLDAPEVADLVAASGAADWVVYHVEATGVEFADAGCVVRCAFGASGEPDGSGPAGGDHLTGTADAVYGDGGFAFRRVSARFGGPWESATPGS